jgi:peptide/nickel transport system permease protein
MSRRPSIDNAPHAKGQVPPPMQAGYWAAVRRRFFKKKLPALGLVIVVLFLLVAVFAPFLAGNRPLLFNGGDGLKMPVFAAFTAEDFLWIGGFAVVTLTWLFGVILRRRRKKKDSSPQASRKQWILATILTLTVLVIGIIWPERLDRSDYAPFRDGVQEAPLCIMPLIPYAPAEFDNYRRLEGPGSEHLLGTDGLGRDLLARIIHGTRISMLVGFVAVSIYVLIGIILGALAGYFGGWTDLLISRLIEIVICFPVFFAILAVFCFLPPNIFWIMILIGLLRWPGVARLTRGEFFRLKNEAFVSAGRALGLSHFRIIFLHMLPNGLAPVLVSATFGIAGAILLESGLSFLNFGADLSWGALLASGKSYMSQSWGITVFPGLAIFLAVTSFNLVGEGLRDALDPRLKT